MSLPENFALHVRTYVDLRFAGKTDDPAVIYMLNNMPWSVEYLNSGDGAAMHACITTQVRARQAQFRAQFPIVCARWEEFGDEIRVLCGQEELWGPTPDLELASARAAPSE